MEYKNETIEPYVAIIQTQLTLCIIYKKQDININVNRPILQSVQVSPILTSALFYYNNYIWFFCHCANDNLLVISLS